MVETHGERDGEKSVIIATGAWNAHTSIVRRLKRYSVSRENGPKAGAAGVLPAFGTKKIVTIKSGDVTVAFGEQEHRVNGHQLSDPC